MSILWGDTETRSHCDLTTAGAYNYAQDRTTEIVLFNWAFDDEDVNEWWPTCGRPFPERVKRHIIDGGQMRFHNAAFDRLIFNYVLCPDFDVPEPRLEQFYCTAAQARSNCGPGSLEDVGRFAGASMKKDHRGKQLIRQLCVPPFNTDPKLFDEFRLYGAQDVRAMRAVSKAMREMSDDELADYHTNERINDRGVLVDTALCEAAARYAAQELTEIEQTVREVTEGAITSVRSPKMRAWVEHRVGAEARKLMIVHKDGEAKVSIDKTVRHNLLALADENPDEVPPDVAEVIQCADDLWASSVAKFNRLAQLADVEDSRVRGAFVFAGGAATGRYSSYGAQLHNMSRKCAAAPDDVRQAMARGHQIVPAYGKRVTDVLRGMLRPAITAPAGRRLIAFDWSAIEARVLPWLSAAPAAEVTLDVFRSGKDIYVSTAAAMFNKNESDVTKEDRMLGKVSVLACGFAGGVGAFAAMGRIYGVNLPESDARRMVDLWRRANPWAVPFWRGLETAYTRAMRNKGHEFSAGRVTYLFDGTHLWYALPSGRVLCYPFAKLEPDGVSYAKASWKPAADAKEWPRARLWPGLAVENVTQGAANCVLRCALRVLDAKGIEVIASVHDEIVAQSDEQNVETVYQTMKEVMCAPPTWAAGIPLDVEGSVMTRYGK